MRPWQRPLISCGGMAALMLGAAAAQAQETPAEVVLDTVVLQGGAATENSGSYVTQAPGDSAAGLPLTVRETPQSVSVLTHQQIRDRNITTLSQAIDSTPGLTAMQGNGEFRWVFYARGSSIENQQFDGLPNYVHYYSRDVNPQEDMAMIDRVEVVRGATGLLEGTGNPSASVNLVRKLPTATRQSSVAAELSSFGNARLTYDTSGPISGDGRLRGRLVASGLGGDGVRDGQTDDRQLYYGTLDYDLTETTRINLGLSHGRENIDGYSWGGIWTRQDGSFYDFDSRTPSAAAWEYSDRRQTVGYFWLAHDFDNGWTLDAKARVSDGTVDMLSSYMYYDDTGTLYRDGALFRYISQTSSADIRLTGQVQLFGRAHDVVLGVNGSRDRTRYDGSNPYNYAFADPAVADPHEHPYPTPNDITYFGDMVSLNYGLYASARWNLAERTKLITGLRLAWYELEDHGGYAGSSYRSSLKADGEVVPYLGLVHDVSDDWTVYGSYTGIFSPQSDKGVDGLLAPVKGKNYEIGAKAELNGGGLGFGAALFQTDRDGLAETDPLHFGCNGPGPTCSVAAGLIRTRGFEIELTGAVTDRWNLSAGYTYAKSKYQEGEDAGRRYATNTTPLHLVKLGTTYRMGGALEGLTLGGALRYQSRIHTDESEGSFDSGGLPYRIEQDAYAVVDIMARYAFSDRTAVQLNVQNLFDERYYSAIASPGYGNFIGPERNATLVLTHDF